MDACAAQVCRLTALVAIKNRCQAHRQAVLPWIRNANRCLGLQVLEAAVAILRARPELTLCIVPQTQPKRGHL